MCRDKKFVTFPNKQVEREVKNLDVYCTNQRKGCRWSGKLNSIRDHLSHSSGCKFEMWSALISVERLYRDEICQFTWRIIVHVLCLSEYCLTAHFANDARFSKCLYLAPIVVRFEVKS